MSRDTTRLEFVVGWLRRKSRALMRHSVGAVNQDQATKSAEMYELAAFMLEDLAKRVPRWISVEERLPEHWHMDDKDRTLINYLVYSPDYGVDVGNYIKPAKRWVCMGLPMNVTHWMPLPKPPEETT